MLGIGMKGRRHNPESDETKQPEYEDIKNGKNHPWIYHTIHHMSIPLQDYSGYIPFENLLHEPIEKEHVVAKIAEDETNKILRFMLTTNSTLTFSKRTNTFSRLGGAYLQRNQKSKDYYNNIACFPIFANLQHQTNRDKMRLCHGILLRGPHHTKSPTDRINFINIEMLKKDDASMEFSKLINNCRLIEYNEFNLVIRSNAINNIFYLMFTHNAVRSS